MIHLINQENKYLYSSTLKQMFEQRANLFIDRLDWNLVAHNGQEMDQFDTEDTIYLVVLNEENGRIRSSLRLNPTSKPHLMSELFSDLCSGGVPAGDRIYEISRYCYNPNILNLRDRMEAMREMMCGVMECSLIHGWEELTFVINMPLLAHCLACGWDIMPLGLPTSDGKKSIGAFTIKINPAGLAAVKKNAGIFAPTLKIIPAKPIAA